MKACEGILYTKLVKNLNNNIEIFFTVKKCQVFFRLPIYYNKQVQCVL